MTWNRCRGGWSRQIRRRSDLRQWRWGYEAPDLTGSDAEGGADGGRSPGKGKEGDGAVAAGRGRARGGGAVLANGGVTAEKVGRR